MEDRRMGAEAGRPGAPEQPVMVERPAVADPSAVFARPAVESVLLDEPGAGAVPVVRLTPVPEPGMARYPWVGVARVAVSGAAVMLITAELGRRAAASGRLTVLCSAGAGAAVVAPWLVPQLVTQFTPRVASP